MGSCVVFRQKLFCVVRGALRLCVFPSPVTQRLSFWNVGNWTESHHQSGCTFLRRSLIKMHFRLQGGKRNIKVDRGDGWLGWWSREYELIVQGDGWGFESQPNRENSLTYMEIWANLTVNICPIILKCTINVYLGLSYLFASLIHIEIQLWTYYCQILSYRENFWQPSWIF